MSARLLAQMLAQQLPGTRIEQPQEHRVPMHVDLASDPATRRSALGRFDIDATIQARAGRFPYWARMGLAFKMGGNRLDVIDKLVARIVELQSIADEEQVITFSGT
jgi:hypothetical protein